MNIIPKPVVLCILDGWGHREAHAHNAIAHAHTPCWDGLLKTYPHGLLNASELHVGLPTGQMGNSEVGHMNIGAGRVVLQDLPRIDAAIDDDSLTTHPELLAFIAALKSSGGACHLMGLISDGGVHSHIHHAMAMATIIASAGIKVWLHVFLDGRDTPPQSAKSYLAQLETLTALHPNIHIATLSGRYFAMDRDNRWSRVASAYHAFMSADCPVFDNASDAIDHAYTHDITDEFVPACSMAGYDKMHDGDGLLMINFRADRARQLLHALLDPQFDGFERVHRVRFAATLGMVEYSAAITPWMPVLFPPQSMANLLGQVVAAHGLTQLRIAETEKYAHVTFFFSGGREEKYEGEDRILIPSPDVATYDLKPEMSAFEVTDALIKAIESNVYDLIVVNFANTDMVGHSGNLKAASQAVEAVDKCLTRLVAAVENAHGAMLITADHGNAEMMHDEQTGQSHTAHTLNLVPVVLIEKSLKNAMLTIPEGSLADIAPTVLSWLGINAPAEMTGRSLIDETRA